MSFPDENETKREVWLALRQDGASGDGSASNPYDASSPNLFADRMNSFQEKTLIHLGPGIFQTFGFNPITPDLHNNFQLKSGQRVLGAGMFVTTIKVVGASIDDSVTVAFYSQYVEGLEIANLTVDANMRGHAGKRVIIGAVEAFGRRVRLRRVRAVDYGTDSKNFGTNIVECFVISTAGPDPNWTESYDCVIDNCLTENPHRNGRYNNTCIMPMYGEDAYHRIPYHRACVVRNCLINNDYQDNPASVSTITLSARIATVTTKTPHGRTTGDWGIITGALVNSDAMNPYNGAFPLPVLDAVAFQYTISYDPAGGADPTGDIWLGKPPGRIIGLKPSVPDPDPDPYNPGEQGVSIEGSGPWTVSLVTQRPHLKMPGQNVAPVGIKVGGFDSIILRDLFPILEIVNQQKLKFLVHENPGEPDVPPAGAYINPTSAGSGGDGGIGTLISNNRIYNTLVGIYHDTWSTPDQILRKNHIYGATQGIYHNLGNGTIREIVSLTHSGTEATFTTPHEHTLQVGQGIIVSDAGDDNYNGRFSIKSIPSPTTFTYEMTGAPAGSGSPFTVLETLWQVGSVLAERNVIELVQELFFSGGGTYGIEIGGAGNKAPYVFDKVLLRENFVGNISSARDNTELSFAVLVDSTQRALIKSTVIDLNTVRPVEELDSCVILKYFKNQSPNGKLFQGILALNPADLSHYRNELAVDADLAFLLST